MPALSMMLKLPKGFHHHLFGVFPEVVESVAKDIDFLLMALDQLGFVIKRIHMAGTTLHEEKNDALGPGRVMGAEGLQRIVPRGAMGRLTDAGQC